MHLTTSTAALALLSTVAVASPIEERGTKTFSIKQVKSHVKVKPVHPAINVLQAYKKFGYTPPSKVQSAAQKAAAQTGTVAANPYGNDVAWLAPVSVGGQTLNLNFDTGSSDLWVYTNLQPSSQISGRAVYNLSKTTTASKLSGQTFNLTYGDGSGVNGVVYSDTVVVGSVTATKQAVEAATSVSPDFTTDVNSGGGIMGLAFSGFNSVTPTKQNNFFDTVKANLASKLFTACLKHATAGSYDFGFISSSKYTGAITYATIIPSASLGYNTYWKFAVNGYQVGSKTRNNTNALGNAIADTGTSLLYFDDTAVKQYWANVSYATFNSNYGGYTFPCATTLPNFSIGINGTLFTVPGSLLNYQAVGSNTCFGGLQSSAGIGFHVLGGPFLKSVLAIFDQNTSPPRIGFAKQA